MMMRIKVMEKWRRYQSIRVGNGQMNGISKESKKMTIVYRLMMIDILFRCLFLKMFLNERKFLKRGVVKIEEVEENENSLIL